MLPLRTRRRALIYSPANLAPAASRRNAVVIHDVAALRHPEAYSVAVRRLPAGDAPGDRPAGARSCSRCRSSRAPSSRSCSGSTPVRSRWLPEAWTGDSAPTCQPPTYAARLSLERPYVLALGTASARKNLAVLGPVAARAGRRRASRWCSRVRTAATCGLRSGPVVRRLGYVAEEDLPALYAGASAFVMPSLHEGFGLPCLEAMAAGTPVVAAAAGALPDTCGDAALLVDPTDPAAIAAALRRAVIDSAVGARLRAAGLARADGVLVGADGPAHRRGDRAGARGVGARPGASSGPEPGVARRTPGWGEVAVRSGATTVTARAVRGVLSRVGRPGAARVGERGGRVVLCRGRSWKWRRFGPRMSASSARRGRSCQPRS